MLLAGLGVVAALAFVLGLGALALWMLKRVSGATFSSRTRVPVEVVQRVSLGPKTGLAVVRVGEKVMAVSVGDGGVRPLFELEEADRQRVIASSTLPVPHGSSAEATAAFAALTPASFGAVPIASLPGALGRVLSRRTMPAVATAHGAAPVTPSVPARPDADDAFRAMLGMSLRNTTRLAVFGGMMVLSALAPRTTRAQAPVQQPPVQQPPVAPAVTPPVAPQTGNAAQVAPQPTAQAATTATTAAAAAAAAPAATPTPLTAAGVRQPQPRPQTQPPARRAGNGASVTPGGTSAARPMSNMRFDSTAASVSPNGRAAAATPAGIAADDAVMRMMPQMDVKIGDATDGGLRLNGTVGIVVMMGLMTLLPTLVLMMTGFTRILIVLHFLKQAMGTQGAPPAHLLAGMALLLTGFVMAPTLAQVNRDAVTPWLDGKMTQVEMLKTGVQPMRAFMVRQTRASDIKTFVELSRLPRPNTVDDVPLHVLMSAFVASELRTAFQIGFAIYLPFIIIDTVVASVLMSMGMFMLPPAMISLPFKLLLFVLVDGWALTIQSLVQSFR